jgi:beta-galactosidase
VRPVADVPAGVEVVRRRGEHGSWLFLLNDTDDEQRVVAPGHDLVADTRVETVVLPAGGVAVVRED